MNNGFCGGNICWIIVLLLLFCNGGCGNSYGNYCGGGCGGNYVCGNGCGNDRCGNDCGCC